MTVAICPSGRHGVEKLQRLYRALGLAKRIAWIQTLNAARLQRERLAELTERETVLRETLERLPVTSFNKRVLGEGRGVEIDKAVQINAALNRKRAAVAEEQRRVINELQPIIATCSRLREAELGVKAKASEVACLLASASECRDESAVEEQWSGWRR